MKYADIPFVPGHLGCAGCAQMLAARLIFETLGKNTIVVTNTGCLEVSTTMYPHTSWGIPFIHSLFENAAAVASGIHAAEKHLGKTSVIVAQAGDGGFADIGLQAFSGMWERGENILSILYDNEAYMNTGIQRSSLTPLGANTMTTPVGEKLLGNIKHKKNMVEIALAHGCVYVATISVHLPVDLQRKIKKAITFKGPKFIHVFVPCPLGWRFEPHLSIEIARLAVETGFFPIIEYENGVLTNVRKIKKVVPIEEYLKLQGRFSHLFETDDGKKIIDYYRDYSQQNIKKYNLLE